MQQFVTHLSNDFSLRQRPLCCTSRPSTIKRGVPASGSKCGAYSTSVCSVSSFGNPCGESRCQPELSFCQIAVIFPPIHVYPLSLSENVLPAHSRAPAPTVSHTPSRLDCRSHRIVHLKDHPFRAVLAERLLVSFALRSWKVSMM